MRFFCIVAKPNLRLGGLTDWSCMEAEFWGKHVILSEISVGIGTFTYLDPSRNIVFCGATA
jgi:hypothetical protein